MVERSSSCGDSGSGSDAVAFRDILLLSMVVVVAVVGGSWSWTTFLSGRTFSMLVVVPCC